MLPSIFLAGSPPHRDHFNLFNWKEEGVQDTLWEERRFLCSLFSAYNYIIYQRHGLPEPTQNHPSSIFAFFPLLFLSLLFFHSGPRLSPPRELAPDHHPLTIESEKKATLRIFYLLSYPTYPTTSLPFFRCGQRQLPATSRNIRIDKTGLESRRASRKIKDKRRKRKKKRQENER